MAKMHRQLLEKQGTRDPLATIAKDIRSKSQVLCLDEFLVLDITDAMILAGLLKALFAEGVLLVTTANLSPDDLYKNGLQRARFTPAIALLKQYTQVVHLKSARDYRLKAYLEEGVYYQPLNARSEQLMRTRFMELAGEDWQAGGELQIMDRLIPILGQGHGVVWFDFNVLCHIPRSQIDYLEIARLYHTVLLSNVPVILPHQDNLIRYLINLVDVFYDAKVKLILSAAVPAAEIYTTGKMLKEFQRTHSRLVEMQSARYLQLAHLR
jgi:cell division protein ZapE